LKEKEKERFLQLQTKEISTLRTILKGLIPRKGHFKIA
jgi:hypothetical protein